MNPNSDMNELDPLASMLDYWGDLPKPNRVVNAEEEKAVARHRKRLASLQVEEFHTPGLHVQGNGMLAYAPDLDKLPYDPRYGRGVREAVVAGNVFDNSTAQKLKTPFSRMPDIKLPGVYLCQSEKGKDKALRHFDGKHWHFGCEANGRSRDLLYILSYERGVFDRPMDEIRILGRVPNGAPLDTKVFELTAHVLPLEN